MAWDTSMVKMLRYHINDFSAEQSFTDARLKQGIVLGAHHVLQENTFSINYCVNIDRETITPDPTLITPQPDRDFIFLTVLKSACLIFSAKLRNAGRRAGVNIQVGSARIKKNDKLAVLQELKDRLCEEYQKVKFDYSLGNVNYRVLLTPAARSLLDGA